MKSTLKDTRDGGPSGQDAEDDGPPVPGVLLVFTEGQPCCVPFPLMEGKLEVGRGDGRSPWPVDLRMSRRHVRLSYDGQQFHAEDLGSQNGTFIDGIPVKPELKSARAQVLRTGDSLFLLCPDLRPYQGAGVRVTQGRLAGPILQAVLNQIAKIASFSTTMNITGESGVGKEGAAQTFHATGPHSSGPFVAVNCATIPQGVAERVLFGAKRGAFSGADADTDGYVQAADGGTLFLDEIAELDLAVQAKLLRVLETKEVFQLGSTRPRALKIRFCSASNKDLRTEVSAGRFREDLYFRLSRPEVKIPSLRRRKEEIPWFIDLVIKAIPGGLTVQTSLVEACLMRSWPGNVRELLTEVRAAGHMALATGKRSVESRHLAASAGQGFVAEPPPENPVPAPQPGGGPTREALERVLRQTAGNVSAAARLLSMHRTQFKRIIDRLGIDATLFTSGTPSAKS
jgi:transcriptional regulator of acetoin/glycerol metabolism